MKTDDVQLAISIEGAALAAAMGMTSKEAQEFGAHLLSLDPADAIRVFARHALTFCEMSHVLMNKLPKAKLNSPAYMQRMRKQLHERLQTLIAEIDRIYASEQTETAEVDSAVN